MPNRVALLLAALCVALVGFGRVAAGHGALGSAAGAASFSPAMAGADAALVMEMTRGMPAAAASVVERRLRGPAGPAVRRMIGRLRAAAAATLGGESAESCFARVMLANPRISDSLLLRLETVPLERLATAPELRARTLRAVPQARALASHRFAVALVAGATGVDADALSALAPDLGLLGSAESPLLMAPPGLALQRSTALHDFTDFLRAAGVEGLNRAVWGSEGRVASAARSLLYGFGLGEVDLATTLAFALGLAALVRQSRRRAPAGGVAPAPS